MFDFTYFYNKLILEPKMKQKTDTEQKLRTTWCNGKLHDQWLWGDICLYICGIENKEN